MPRKRKESKPFNIRMDKAVYDKLEEFCDTAGQTKTVAVERAVLMYVEHFSDQEKKEQ